MACPATRERLPAPELRRPSHAVTHAAALQHTRGPVVAVSDPRASCRTRSKQWVPSDFASLGADGFGFSDTRPAAGRFFHIDGPSVAVRAWAARRPREVPGHTPARRPTATGSLDVTAGTSGNSGGES